jgi:hypothetical protein
MRHAILDRLAGASLLASVVFATPATAAVSEPELAQISLNAISLCVHAALYQHDGLNAAALYSATLTVEHPAGQRRPSGIAYGLSCTARAPWTVPVGKLALTRHCSCSVPQCL